MPENLNKRLKIRGYPLINPKMNNNNLNAILTTDIKPEDCLIEKPKTFGKYNVSIDRILELKAQKMGYRKIGKELGVNYKVIQRALKSHLIKRPESQIKACPATEEKLTVPRPEKIEYNSIEKCLDSTYFQIGQLIVSGYANSNLNFKDK
jgi:hypothetical protein